MPQSGLTCTDLPNCQTIIDILQSINDIVSGLPSSYFSCGDLAVCQTIIDIVSDISDLQTQVGTNTTDISTLQGYLKATLKYRSLNATTKYGNQIDFQEAGQESTHTHTHTYQINYDSRYT